MLFATFDKKGRDIIRFWILDFGFWIDMKTKIVNLNFCCRQKIKNFISSFALHRKIQNPKSKIQN
jgi:hypothetical protein